MFKWGQLHFIDFIPNKFQFIFVFLLIIESDKEGNLNITLPATSPESLPK